MDIIASASNSPQGPDLPRTHHRSHLDETLLQSLDHYRLWLRKGVDSEPALLAFYDSVRLRTEPIRGFVDAARQSFSSQYWVRTLSAKPTQPDSLNHLAKGNIYAGHAIAKHMASLESDKRLYFDAGVGRGNTALQVLSRCREKNAPVENFVGCELAAQLLGGVFERLRASVPDMDPAQIRVCQGEMLEQVTHLELASVAAATANYSVHHLSNPDSVVDALGRGGIIFDNNSNCYYYRPPFADLLGDCPHVPLPNFEEVLQGYLGEQTSAALELIRIHGPNLKAQHLEPFAFRDMQLEFFTALRSRMQSGAIFVHFDPDRGLSKFNRSHINLALDENNPDALESAREIGVACFNSKSSATARLEKAGFKVPINSDLEDGNSFYQVRILSGKTPILAHVTGNTAPVVGTTLSAGVVDDVLGWGIVAVAS